VEYAGATPSEALDSSLEEAEPEAGERNNNKKVQGVCGQEGTCTKVYSLYVYSFSTSDGNSNSLILNV
jgi:hypothetical protein